MPVAQVVCTAEGTFAAADEAIGIGLCALDGVVWRVTAPTHHPICHCEGHLKVKVISFVTGPV